MSDLYFFQRFSQRENVDTNNTLLLLSLIQASDPRLLQDVLAVLFGDDIPSDLHVGIRFSQQTSKPDGKSRPDGMVFQSSFRIVLETKRKAQDFDIGQLQEHLSQFRDETAKILLLLAPERTNDVVVPGASAREVTVVSRSFSDIIAACRDAKVHENLSLKELVEDYERYCVQSGLMPIDGRVMAVAAGTTFDDHVELRLYYTPVNRFFKKPKYIALYMKRSIHAIGELENIVCADLDEGDKLTIKDKEFEVTIDQKERILRAIDSSFKYKDYNIGSKHRFFLVKEFVPTNFRKTTDGNVLQKQYLDLREVLDLTSGTDLPDVQAIADKLKLEKYTW
jgi:hypothetical protein